MYADVTWIFVWDLEDEAVVMGVIDRYQRESNAKVNLSKLHSIPSGKTATWMADSNERISFLAAGKEFIYLKCTIHRGIFPEVIWNPIISKMTKEVWKWKWFNLSYRSKALLLNTFVLSKLWYLAGVIPPTVAAKKQIKRIILDFVWNSRAAKISYKDLCQETKKGALD